jgi:uncharacterized protein YjiS (DUF1127 family)
LLEMFVRVIRRIWHAYWHWRARQAMLMFLHSLDERTLKDFGVTREEMNCFLDEQFTRARRQRSMRGWLCSMLPYVTGITVTPKARNLSAEDRSPWQRPHQWSN